MALGKNLKKKKLIEDQAKEPKRKVPVKKKVVPKKKVLIKTPKKVEKKIASKRPVAKKEDKETSNEVNSGIPLFIAQELHDLKNQLRKKYNEEIQALRGKSVQFVSFAIAGEVYAVNIDCVKEVVPIPQLSKTPNTPLHIKGIANVRGRTYVVYDLAAKFKVDKEDTAQFLLIVKGQGVTASLMLNLLPSTFKMNGDNISSDMSMIEDASMDVSYIKGLIQHNNTLIYYLDIIELLRNDKAFVVPNKLPNKSV